MEALESVSVILAADVIYSDSITDALFGMLTRLMPGGSKKVRILFVLRD
jgi:predicted nicotinamide N-methyase